MNAAPLRWLPLLLAALLPSLAVAQTLDRVRASGTLTLGYLPDQPPFSVSEGDGASGYGVDLCQKVADQLRTQPGLAQLRTRFVPLAPEKALDVVREGGVDLLCSPVVETLKRRETLAFSLPVYTAGVGVVLRQDASPHLVRVLKGEESPSGPTWRATVNRGLTAAHFVVQGGTVVESWARERLRLLKVLVTLDTVPSALDGVQKVAKGEADAFFADQMMLRSLVQRDASNAGLMVLDRRFEFEPVSLAMARGDEDFRLQVDTALSRFYRSGDMVPLYTRYFGPPGDLDQTLFKVYSRR
ncbi:amino acid ABC transporter substrate-binding protein [Metapseudomonas furukawaii]|uniref:Glutamate Aspartate periplasmic binding protein GltI n=1 Tax=Metapseudomonas furukawaii TaxID=1149133 RepID=A0AAD1C2L5_METFU|nr:amino acid ABC transporter substrate-binding protein [Pseudomonas furukawaii]ELS30091.1 extracellular solute-binding protein, family 3 [Pseudomonas furukawaii]BAU75600.1 glutamate Aspartate periplasmic binding protein precursor GltI [Pseudomonas furukawaii]